MAQTYTPSSSATPTFGTQSASNLSLQKAINSIGGNVTTDGRYGSQTQAAYNNLVNQGYSYSNGAFVKGENNNTINSNNLQDKGKVTLPDANFGTSGASLVGNLEGYLKTSKESAQRSYDQLNATQDETLKNIFATMGDIGKSEQYRQDAYAQNGVDAKQKLNDSFTAQLEAEQSALRRTTENILGNGGMTRAQAAPQIAEAQRLSAIKQADVALAQLSSGREYERAKAIADRQVEAKLEPLKIKLDAYKFFYENNSHLLDRADAKIVAAQQQEYDYAKEQAQQISQLKLKLAANGASPALLGTLDTVDSFDKALNLPGITNYFTSPADKLDLQLKKLQIAKAKSELTGDSNKILSIDDAQKLGVPYGTTQAQAIALQGGSKQLTENQIRTLSSADQLLGRINSTLIKSNLPVGSGRLAGIALPGSSRADFNANFNNLKSLLTLDNLKFLKGPMSDNDIVFLTQASTQLNRNQSIGEFTKTLTSIRDTLQKADPNYQYAQAAANLATQQDNNSVSTYINSLLNPQNQ